MTDCLEYYKILNVSPHSNEEDIRLSYRELAKFWHPDHNTDEHAVDMFQKISNAYDVLKDTQSRLKYDILSMIYNKSNFPDMNSLCIIRNMHGQEDLNLRAFHLIEVTGKGIGHSSIDKIYYCSQYEAKTVINSITKHNWLLGFWGVTSIFANISALVKNILRINNKQDNLTLLMHNSLVYKEENKFPEAITLALLAKTYASKTENKLIDQYLTSLPQTEPLNVKKWDFKKLQRIQLIYPLSFLLLVCFIIFGGYFFSLDTQINNVSLKQVVVFKDGQKTFSDVAVAKIFNIPVDVYDKEKLYHLIKQTQAMYGADKDFDVYKTVEKGLTVRLTGYTADNKWARVMFDNGEMAFVEMDTLEKGIGNEIPLWSKIYKE